MAASQRLGPGANRERSRPRLRGARHPAPRSGARFPAQREGGGWAGSGQPPVQLRAWAGGVECAVPDAQGPCAAQSRGVGSGRGVGGWNPKGRVLPAWHENLTVDVGSSGFYLCLFF